MAVVTPAETLHSRIVKKLRRSRDPDPSKIARTLRSSLSVDEEEDLIATGLQDAVYDALHATRRKAIAKSTAERWARLDAERVAARAEKEAAEERRRQKFDEEQRERMRDPIYRVQREVADALHRRETDIRLSMLNIRGQRVNIDGDWMLLEDCEEGHLLALAGEYAERAVDQNMRGAYYLALATVLRESGLRTVGELCEQQP